VDIYGEWIQSAYSDTDFAATPATPLAAIGFNIVQKEVGAYDPLYGDFKLIHWTFTNRDAVAKGPIYPGTHIDWDINTGVNYGLVSDLFNGYAQWDIGANATIAYGMFDVNMPSTYDGLNTAANSPSFILLMSNPTRVYSTYWDYSGTGRNTVWSKIVHEQPRRIVDPPIGEDKGGVLIGKPFTVGPNGVAEWSAAVYGVDATSDNAATIEANAIGVAKRAARWSGFARGDINEDGKVDLADVCWMKAWLAATPGIYLYPGDYCGDVDASGITDAADDARLLNFVSGVPGNDPLGAWRF